MYAQLNNVNISTFSPAEGFLCVALNRVWRIQNFPGRYHTDEYEAKTDVWQRHDWRPCNIYSAYTMVPLIQSHKKSYKCIGLNREGVLKWRSICGCFPKTSENISFYCRRSLNWNRRSWKDSPTVLAKCRECACQLTLYYFALPKSSKITSVPTRGRRVN